MTSTKEETGHGARGEVASFLLDRRQAVIPDRLYSRISEITLRGTVVVATCERLVGSGDRRTP